MFIHTQLYFDNHVSYFIRGWRIDQVLSQKYFFNSAITPAHCTGAGVGASTFIKCNLHSMTYCSKYNQISVLEINNEYK